MHKPLRSVGYGIRSDRGEAALARIHRLSTAGLPVSERFPFWREVFAKVQQPLVIEAEPDSFDGVLTRFTDGELEIMSVKSTPLRSRNDARSGCGERRFSLQLVHSGRCHLKHAGADIVAEQGDLVVVDARKPYELTFDRPVHGLVLPLPCERFGDHAEVLEQLAGQPIN